MHAIMTFVFLFFGFKAVNCDGVEVHLYPYKYKDTKCTSGLLVDMPLHLEGILRLPVDIKESGHYIYIERKEFNKEDFEHFDVIFNNCELSQQFFCKPLGNTTMYELYIHAKANVDLSESEWKLKGNYRGKDFESEDIRAPKIFNISDIKMTVNGQVWSIGNTSLDVNTDQLTICCIPGGAPWPCEAAISVNSQPSEFGSPCVTHKIDTSMKTTLAEVKLGFRVCGNDTFSQIYSPNVIVKAKIVPGIVSYSETWIIAPIFGSFVIIVVVVIIVLFIKGLIDQRNPVTESSTSREPLLHQKGQAGIPSTSITIQQESDTVVKPKKKGKKNKGTKAVEPTAPETSKPTVTRVRTYSDSAATRKRNVTNTRKMKTK